MQLGGVVGSSIQSKAGGMKKNGGEIHLVTGVGYGLCAASAPSFCTLLFSYSLKRKKELIEMNPLASKRRSKVVRHSASIPRI